MSNDNFGNRLREIREKSNISRSDLANALGISRHTLSGYENGHRTPNIELIRKIADFFNITTDWLLGRTDNLNSKKLAIPKYTRVQFVILIKIAQELLKNKDIQINDKTKKYLEIFDDLNFLASMSEDMKQVDIDGFELIKIIPGSNAFLDKEEELGYDLLDKSLLDNKSDYFIYICGDNSMSPEYNIGDRVLIKSISSHEECKDKDTVIIKRNDDHLIRRFYKNDNHIILQANNSDFPPILVTYDEADIKGIVQFKLIDE